MQQQEQPQAQENERGGFPKFAWGQKYALKSVA
jgi:hypothetical protein